MNKIIIILNNAIKRMNIDNKPINILVQNFKNFFISSLDFS